MPFFSAATLCVSIHHMLRFNAMQKCIDTQAFMFQYITCYGLIKAVERLTRALEQFQYITCYGLINN